MARAIKGGQIGKNGERYEGGQFLPNTELTKMARSNRRAGTGRQQISPFVWEVAPEGKKSLFQLFNVFVNWQTMQINEQGCAYYRRSVDEIKSMFSRWQAGERWV